MCQTIAIHSHKGGTGKTLLSVNFAYLLAEMGYRVVLLDLDLSAPSLQTFFHPPDSVKSTMTEFLIGQNVEPEEFIFNMNLNLKGELYVGLASIDSELLTKLENRKVNAHLNDLYKLIGLIKKKLKGDPWNVDYVIVDTSPGISTFSVNSIAICDQLVMVQRLFNADLQGTVELLKFVHKSLKPDTSIILNMIPAKFQEESLLSQILSLIDNKIIKQLKKKNIEFRGIVYYDEKLIDEEINYALQSTGDSTSNNSRVVFSQKYRQSDFVTNLKSIVKSVISKE